MKLACVLALLLTEEVEGPAVAASIEKLSTRASGAIPQQRAAEAVRNAQRRIAYRGTKLNFPAGLEVYRQWSGLIPGDIVGSPALTSATFCIEVAAGFLSFPDGNNTCSPSVMFVYSDMPEGVRMWMASAWANEVELLLGSLLLWRIAKAPVVSSYSHPKKGSATALTVQLQYHGIVKEFSAAEFRKQVHDDAVSAERVLRQPLTAAERVLREPSDLPSQEMTMSTSGTMSGTGSSAGQTPSVRLVSEEDGSGGSQKFSLSVPRSVTQKQKELSRESTAQSSVRRRPHASHFDSSTPRRRKPSPRRKPPARTAAGEQEQVQEEQMIVAINSFHVQGLRDAEQKASGNDGSLLAAGNADDPFDGTIPADHGMYFTSKSPRTLGGMHDTRIRTQSAHGLPRWERPAPRRGASATRSVGRSSDLLRPLQSGPRPPQWAGPPVVESDGTSIPPGP